MAYSTQNESIVSYLKEHGIKETGPNYHLERILPIIASPIMACSISFVV